MDVSSNMFGTYGRTGDKGTIIGAKGHGFNIGASIGASIVENGGAGIGPFGGASVDEKGGAGIGVNDGADMGAYGGGSMGGNGGASMDTNRTFFSLINANMSGNGRASLVTNTAASIPKPTSCADTLRSQFHIKKLDEVPATMLIEQITRGTFNKAILFAMKNPEFGILAIATGICYGSSGI